VHPLPRKRTIAAVWVAFALAALGATGVVESADGDAPAPRTSGVWAGR